VNIRCYNIFYKWRRYCLWCVGVSISFFVTTYAATDITPEPVDACVVLREKPLTPEIRAEIAACLDWKDEPTHPMCHGYYTSVPIIPLSDPKAVELKADTVQLYQDKPSQLKGHVEVQQIARIVNAETAVVYRNAKKNTIERVELLGNVRYREEGRLMMARHATLYPESGAGRVEDVLYRLHINREHALLPAWGRARWVERFANQNLQFREATYSTCPPKAEAWRIEAKEINLDHDKAMGVAKDATLRVNGVPIFYTPYFTFPATNERKTGFLMPLVGYSNISGFDWAWPYYLNLAPNYDATITPHLYAMRGMMASGEFRYLVGGSYGVLKGSILPYDRDFKQFLNNNSATFPSLDGLSDNRWMVQYHDATSLGTHWRANVDYQQVSDDYYFQDFSSNLAIITLNQLLRQADLSYTDEHWVARGMVQSYQTLHPVNQSMVADIYERLPQLMGEGTYADLPLNAEVKLFGQYDQFHWTADADGVPQGPRVHVNPRLSFPWDKSYGFVRPGVELVENWYDVHYQETPGKNEFNRLIPRYHVDTGLFFERDASWFKDAFTQTLEPRLFYLYVPYQNQSNIPVYDSAYMIFNTEQLFRTNRFSGFDRIENANQLSYALTSRWLFEKSGREQARVTVGQTHYFSDREVGLCYSRVGPCIENPLFLGYTSPTAAQSPIAGYADYHMNAHWSVSGDYVWDPFTSATNNGDINLQYTAEENRLLKFSYAYLINGNVFIDSYQVAQIKPLHQATIAYAWPLRENWSSLGVYSYNVSENNTMLALLGLQYDTCCWAARLIGGRAFDRFKTNSDLQHPAYNNNVYLQILLKGLGSVASSDPSSTIHSYLPNYQDLF
jgi:LPS-assembly protein